MKREKYIINIKKHNKREKIKKIKETEVEDLFKLFINKEKVNNILIKKRSKKNNIKKTFLPKKLKLIIRFKKFKFFYKILLNKVFRV